MRCLIPLLFIAVFAPHGIAGGLDDLWKAGSYGKSPSVTVLHTGGGGSMISGRPLELVYLTLRGLAELPRLILEEGGIPYIGTYYGREDFKKVKSSYPFGRVPVLKGALSDGSDLSQSKSIVRYLSRLTNTDGATDEEKLLVDQAFETYVELFKGGHRSFSINAEELKKGPAGPDDKPMHFRDMSNRGEYSAYQKAVTALVTFEEMLAGKSFLVGDSLTYVDLALWSSLFELEEEDSVGSGWDAGFPNLKKFKAAVEGRPNIQAYLQSDRLMPRVKRDDAANDYVFVEGNFSRKPQEVEVEVKL